MAETFINKIKLIILNNIENEQFGVGDLSNELGLSRSQTLRKIKAATGKSANQFIREVRLDEAVKLIQTTDLTASEIAYKVGFSSPSYFNKCFLTEYEVTPGEYKKRFDKNIEVEKTVKNSNNFSSKSSVLYLIIIALIVVTSGLLILKVSKLKNSTEPGKKSIAVLPFKDCSENNEKEYLTVGITDRIISELAKNHSLRVVSRGTTLKYKNGNKSYPEIAKEIGVDLLLEGSALYDYDSMSLVVQLIEPFPNERQIWQNNYDQKLTNLLQISRNVSADIAKKIHLAVAPQINTEDTYPINSEAYDLYLKGRYLLINQKIKYSSLQTALELLKKSIDLDPGFSSAYTTLAEIYVSMNTLTGSTEEGIKNLENAKKAAKKALELDNSNAEAYIVLGNLIGKVNWDWETMKEMAEKGLKFQPSNSKGHLLLSDYYIIKGDYQKSIKEALIAESLEPLNISIYCMVAERYYIFGDYNQSIKKYKEALELDPYSGFALNGIGYAYYQNREREKCMESWMKLQTIMGNDSLYWYYDNKGFEEGLHYYLRQAEKKLPRFCPNPMVRSSIYMMVENKQQAIDFIKVSLETKNKDLPIMITFPDFYPLHNDSEFQKIVQEVGVVFPN